MHLQPKHIRQIRAFLNHTLPAQLPMVDTLDYELIAAYKGWVTGVRGVSGHDGSFPSNPEAIPAVVAKFGAPAAGKDVAAPTNAPAKRVVLRDEAPDAPANPDLERLLAAAQKSRPSMTPSPTKNEGQRPDRGVVQIA